jgi:hypothetical protein
MLALARRESDSKINEIKLWVVLVVHRPWRKLFPPLILGRSKVEGKEASLATG